MPALAKVSCRFAAVRKKVLDWMLRLDNGFLGALWAETIIGMGTYKS